MRLRIRLALIPTMVGMLCLWVVNTARELRAQEQQSKSLPPGPAPPSPGRVLPGRAIITYQNDELTIEAQNASLSDVLREVCSQTGAAIDIPSEVDERVFGRWGPGPARNVVASLLHATQFNYVMQGLSDGPDGLAQIFLFPKPPNPAAGRESAHRTQPTTPGRTDSIQQRVPKQQETERQLQANAVAARIALGRDGGVQDPTVLDSAALIAAASQTPVDLSATGPGKPADQSAAGPGNSGDNQGAGQMPTVPRRRRRH